MGTTARGSAEPLGRLPGARAEVAAPCAPRLRSAASSSMAQVAGNGGEAAASRRTRGRGRAGAGGGGAAADSGRDWPGTFDVDEDPLPPPPPPSSSSTSGSKPPPPPPSHPQPQPIRAADSLQQQRLLDLSAELDEERRLRRAAEDALSSSETRLGRLKAFAQDALRKLDESSASAAASARALQALQAEAATASSMLYQIAIEVSELEAAVASRAAESESLSKSLSDRETELSSLRDQITTLRPLLAEQIGCASRLYDEVRQVVALVDADAAGALPDSVFVWKEADVEESLKVSLEGTRMAFDIASMALHKVGAWRDRGNSKMSELQLRVEELIREKEHIGVLLRSALQANTSEVLKVAEDGLREAGIEIGLNGHRDHRPGSADKDEAGALENSMKESQIKIIELQHLVEAQRHCCCLKQESLSSLFAMASELGSPPPAAKRTIMDLGDDLLLEIFVLLPSLPSLVRAALACPTFLHAVRSSPAFRRRFQSLHPPQLLGFFCDHCSSIPSFFPLRGRCDPDHTAVISHADFSFTRLTEDSAHYLHGWDILHGWEIQSCHGGYAILVNIMTDKIAAYNPLAQALHIFPMPPAKFHRSGAIEFHIIFSEEDLGVFRMVCVVHSVVHRKTPTCIAVVSSATRKWTRVPQPDDGGEDFLEFGVDSGFDTGRQVNALVYWKHLRQEYALVLNTTTLQISRVDLSVGVKGCQLGHTNDGQLCMVGADDSDPDVGKLFVWLWRADDDGIEKWILEDTCQLSTLADQDDATVLFDTVGTTVHVEAVIDGFVYLYAEKLGQQSLLSLCLETKELNTLFEDTYAKFAEPYFMAWPLSLICNKVGKLTKSKKQKKRRKGAKNPPKAYPPVNKV